MLPDYNTCIDRIKAYNQTQVHNRKREKIGKSKRPLKIGFGGFWKYKEDVESKGGNILDDEWLHETASKLYAFLHDWGMTQTTITGVSQMTQILAGIGPYYAQISNVKLGAGEMDRHRKQLEAIWQRLNGITNRKQHPDRRNSSITGKSKTLLAIWGQTPGFDTLTRKNFLTWPHPPEPSSLPHLRHGERWYDASAFCDILEELDDWVVRWPDYSGGRVFADSFAGLCPGLPLGRIIDMIYNWEFEYEAIKHYLYLLEDRGEQEKTLSFEEAGVVVGFDLPQRASEDSEWWQRNIGYPLLRSQGKRRRNAKPWWEMVRVDVGQQRVVFALSTPDEKLVGTSIGAASLKRNSKAVKQMTHGGKDSQPSQSRALDLPKGFYFTGTVVDERNNLKDGWRRRSISRILVDESTGYPKLRAAITMIDTDGNRYKSRFAKSRKKPRGAYVYVAEASVLEHWHIKHYLYGEVEEDTVYFEYTGRGHEFYIYTSKEWYDRKRVEAQQESR